MIRRMIRKIKHRASLLFGPTETVYSNEPFDKTDNKLIMDRDVCVHICSYNKDKGVYIVIAKPFKQYKDF
jgi:hypothetical protein